MADIVNLLAAAAGAGGEAPVYEIERSLRFNSADSAYLNRTPASAGNRKTWTWSGWVKRSKLGVSPAYIFSSGEFASGPLLSVEFLATDELRFYVTNAAISVSERIITSAKFRDPSSWYHIVVAVDTTQATYANRVKMYVNGVLQSVGSTLNPDTQITLNADLGWNRSVRHVIGAFSYTPITDFYNGYLTEIHFVDGQALTPSSFGETDATTGVWVPKAYAGTYGTNGFYLDFADNTSGTTIGYDVSGNGNNWTSSGISVSAGAGNDSLVDTPTLYGTDNGIGGEVRGNYATFNPLSAVYTTDTYSEGNLKLVGGTAYATTRSSIGFVVGQGKFYAEITRTAYNSNSADYAVGIHDNAAGGTASTAGNNCMYYANGQKGIDGTRTSYGSGYGNNDVIGIAVDTDAETVTFYKNGVSQGAISYTFSGNVYFFATLGGGAFSSGDTVIGNFGQRPFAYTAPSGFKALCTQNLAEGTITTSGTFTGNGSTNGPFVYLNGVPTAMTIGGNAVTFGTHADKLANGFKIRSSSASYNASGSSMSYTISTTGAKFKYANAQPNP